ncbi:UNVERIFIED_CONTAM: hypothetical protein K2H54_015666 [Gekko kuhli]
MCYFACVKAAIAPLLIVVRAGMVEFMERLKCYSSDASLEKGQKDRAGIVLLLSDLNASACLVVVPSQGAKYATQFPCPRGYYNPDPMSHSLDSCLPCLPGHFCGKENLTTVSGKCDAGDVYRIYFRHGNVWTLQAAFLKAKAGSASQQPGLPSPLIWITTPMTTACAPPRPLGQNAPRGSIAQKAARNRFRAPRDFTATHQVCLLPVGSVQLDFIVWVEPLLPNRSTALRATSVHREPTALLDPQNRASANPAPSPTCWDEAGLLTANSAPPGFTVKERDCTPPLENAGKAIIVTTARDPSVTSPSTRVPRAIIALQETAPRDFGARGVHRFPIQWMVSRVLPALLDITVRQEPLIPWRAHTEPGLVTRGIETSRAANPAPQDISATVTASRLHQDVAQLGFYCPEGTGLNWQPCPPGTYGPNPGVSSRTDCISCDGGKFCLNHNASDVTGLCWEGYFCSQGAERPNPENQHNGHAGPCPTGHYCPRGTAVPQPCPVGTFGPRNKLSSELLSHDTSKPERGGRPQQVF